MRITLDINTSLNEDGLAVCKKHIEDGTIPNWLHFKLNIPVKYLTNDDIPALFKCKIENDASRPVDIGEAIQGKETAMDECRSVIEESHGFNQRIVYKQSLGDLAPGESFLVTIPSHVFSKSLENPIIKDLE